MGKRGKKPAETEALDRASSASTSTFADLANGLDAEDLDESSAIERAIDALYEKRAATREAGLSSIIEYMHSFSSFYDIEERHDTLSTLLANCIRRGGSAEQERATRAIGMMFVTLGLSDESGRILEDRRDLLMKVAKAGKSTDAKVAGLRVLSLAVFVACQDQLDLLETMEFLQSVFAPPGSAPAPRLHEDDPEGKGGGKEEEEEERERPRAKKTKAPAAEVRAAAVRAWTLLLTTVPRELLLRAGYADMCLAAFGRLLHEDSVELRESAGDAAAVLWEAMQVPQDDGGNWTGDCKEPEMDVESEGLARQFEPIRARAAELARNMGDANRRSKKDRAQQKSTFKDVLGILDGDGVTPVKLKLRHGDCLEVDTAGGIAQLDAFRGFLAGGFQDHLQNNPLLHDVFDYAPQQEASERLSKTEKRMFRSKNSSASRARHRSIGNARSQAASSRHGLLGEAW